MRLTLATPSLAISARRPTTIFGEALSPSIKSARVPELSVAIAIASVSLCYPVDFALHAPPPWQPTMALRTRIAYVEAHDPAPSSGRSRRPRFPDRRLVLRLPRLLSVDPAGSKV